MGFWDYISTNTVYSIYKDLIKLFENTHQSFTITRNEKNIVEFTLQGFETGELQYGCIKQDIVAPSVIISIHTLFEGIEVCVDKTFDQSANQIDMYNAVMMAYMDKVHGIVNTHYTDEVSDDVVNDKETPTGLIPLADFVQAHGKLKIIHIINKVTGDHTDICVLHNDGNDYTFVGFSPYLGTLTPDTIIKEKDRLYIKDEGEGGYFLCTHESEIRKREDVDESSWFCHDVEYRNLKAELAELNIYHNVDNYEFGNII